MIYSQLRVLFKHLKIFSLRLSLGAEIHHKMDGATSLKVIDEPVHDNIDAHVIANLFTSSKTLSSQSKPAQPPPTNAFQQPREKPISFATYSKYYDTTNERRGVALIFNHFQFINSKLSPRSGTNKDRDAMAHVLHKLKFDVRVYDDLRYVQLINVLSQVANEDHTNCDCIVIVVMSHGDDGIVYASDSSYPVSELWNSFVGHNCKTLIGKPKMVFVNACRGDKFDRGTTFAKGGDRVDSVAIPKAVTYFIPQMADLIVMYSTFFEGHYSWRNPEMGSWFIQGLCAELLQNGETDDLMTILTSVCRRVAYEYQSNVPGKFQMDCMKQMPCITSMLTKTFYFTKKLK